MKKFCLDFSIEEIVLMNQLYEIFSVADIKFSIIRHNEVIETIFNRFKAVLEEIEN